MTRKRNDGKNSTHPNRICGSCEHRGMNLVVKGGEHKVRCPNCGESATLKRDKKGEWKFQFRSSPLFNKDGTFIVFTDEGMKRMSKDSVSAEQWLKEHTEVETSDG